MATQIDPMEEHVSWAMAGSSTPVADRIRMRIRESGRRFHANDNIQEFIEEDELPQLEAEVAEKMRAVLETLVIDTDSDHNTNETAERVAKLYVREVFGGRYVAPPKVTEFPNAARLNELMIIGPVTVRSACSHHFCPIIGRLWVGVMPNEHSALIGLSKYARLAEWVMSRPQIQEAISQLADLLRADAAGQARRGHGSRPLLHAVARRPRRGLEDDQQRDARFVSQGQGPAARVSLAAERSREPLGRSRAEEGRRC